MVDRNKREKASDVFGKSIPMFGERVTFEEAFPQIEEIEVRVKETGRGVYEWNGEKVFGKNRLGEYVDCSNSLCYNGGFSIGRIIRGMVSKRESKLETTKICQGYEGSPKGRRRYKKCYNGFHVRVSIKYKEDQDDN